MTDGPTGFGEISVIDIIRIFFRIEIDIKKSMTSINLMETSFFVFKYDILQFFAHIFPNIIRILFSFFHNLTSERRYPKDFLHFICILYGKRMP